jgi:hypothetical protein
LAFRAKSHGILRWGGCNMPRSQTMARTANIHHLVFCKSVIHFLRLWHFAQWLCDLGILQPAQTPSRSKIRQICRPCLYTDGYAIVLTLETADF